MAHCAGAGDARVGGKVVATAASGGGKRQRRQQAFCPRWCPGGAGRRAQCSSGAPRLLAAPEQRHQARVQAVAGRQARLPHRDGAGPAQGEVEQMHRAAGRLSSPRDCSSSRPSLEPAAGASRPSVSARWSIASARRRPSPSARLHGAPLALGSRATARLRAIGGC